MSTESRLYELTYILPPALAEEEVTSVQDTINTWITNQAGEVLKANHWGRRKLAYPIQNYKEGYYIYTEFQSEPKAITDVDRRLRLQAEVLRHLIVRVDE